MTYVEIDTDDWRFQPRVAAVCVWQGHVLLQAALDGDFWVLPGGRVQPLELTTDALVRTMRWEISEVVTVRRLLWVMEYVTEMAGKPLHELGFYYLIDLPESSTLLDLARDHAGVERGHDLLLRWFPVETLSQVPLLPEFLRTSMAQLPGSPEHVVRVEKST